MNSSIIDPGVLTFNRWLTGKYRFSFAGQRRSAFPVLYYLTYRLGLKSSYEYGRWNAFHQFSNLRFLASYRHTHLTVNNNVTHNTINNYSIHKSHNRFLNRWFLPLPGSADAPAPKFPALPHYSYSYPGNPINSHLIPYYGGFREIVGVRHNGQRYGRTLWFLAAKNAKKREFYFGENNHPPLFNGRHYWPMTVTNRIPVFLPKLSPTPTTNTTHAYVCRWQKNIEETFTLSETAKEELLLNSQSKAVMEQKTRDCTTLVSFTKSLQEFRELLYHRLKSRLLKKDEYGIYPQMEVRRLVMPARNNRKDAVLKKPGGQEKQGRNVYETPGMCPICRGEPCVHPIAAGDLFLSDETASRISPHISHNHVTNRQPAGLQPVRISTGKSFTFLRHRSGINKTTFTSTYLSNVMSTVTPQNQQGRRNREISIDGPLFIHRTQAAGMVQENGSSAAQGVQKASNKTIYTGEETTIKTVSKDVNTKTDTGVSTSTGMHGIDIRQLSDRVYRHLERRLKLEKERRGW